MGGLRGGLRAWDTRLARIWSRSRTRSEIDPCENLEVFDLPPLDLLVGVEGVEELQSLILQICKGYYASGMSLCGKMCTVVTVLYVSRMDCSLDVQ